MIPKQRPYLVMPTLDLADWALSLILLYLLLFSHHTENSPPLLVILSWLIIRPPGLWTSESLEMQISSFIALSPSYLFLSPKLTSFRHRLNTWHWLSLETFSSHLHLHLQPCINQNLSNLKEPLGQMAPFLVKERRTHLSYVRTYRNTFRLD